MSIRRNALGLTVASMLCTTGLQAEGPVDGKVYGRLDLNYGTNDNKVSEDAWRVSSAASRFGFKGKTKLDGNLEAVYKIEFGVNADDGASGSGKGTDTDVDTNTQTISQRNVHVGIQGAFGGIHMGKTDTPLKKAQGKFDLFNDYEGDIGKILLGENRESNQLFYVSPDFSGARLTVAAIPGEQNGVDDEDGPADATSVSLSYTMGGIYVALAADTDVKTRKQSVTRGVVNYKVADLKLGALYQTAKLDEGAMYPNAEEEADGMGASLAYTIGKVTVKAQHVASEQKVEEGTSSSFGVDYKLGEKTKTYVFYTAMDGKADADQTTITAAGIQHKF